MSALLAAAKGALGGFSAGGIGGAIFGAGAGLFGGGNGGPNIAKSLSQQVGCTIRQSDANNARALIKQGVDPCTMQNIRADSAPNRTDLFPLPGIGGPVGVPTMARPPVTVSQQPTVTGPGGTPMMARTGGGALEFTATGLIRNVIVNGRRISRKNAAAFIRKAGMDVGAQGLGLSLQQAAMVVLQQSARPRRRKGISGAQITQAKRVINTINSMAKSLGCATPRRRAPARKTSCR